MMGGIDMKLNTKPGKAGFECFKSCYEAGVNFKATGDCLIIAPQFICEEKHIDEIIDKLRTGITNYQKNQKKLISFNLQFKIENRNVMKIGVPKEIKPQENRIGLTPQSVKTLSF